MRGVLGYIFTMLLLLLLLLLPFSLLRATVYSVLYRDMHI